MMRSGRDPRETRGAGRWAGLRRLVDVRDLALLAGLALVVSTVWEIHPLAGRMVLGLLVLYGWLRSPADVAAG